MAMALSPSSNAMLATAAHFGEWSGAEAALTKEKLLDGFNQDNLHPRELAVFWCKVACALEDGLWFDSRAGQAGNIGHFATKEGLLS
jgi:hypothetical protein